MPSLNTGHDGVGPSLESHIGVAGAGEGSEHKHRNENTNSSLSMLSIDIPLDGMGLVGMPAAEAISPVFTLWITLVVMYLGESQISLKSAGHQIAF